MILGVASTVLSILRDLNRLKQVTFAVDVRERWFFYITFDLKSSQASFMHACILFASRNTVVPSLI